MFTYNCEVTYIVDGDTCDVKIFLLICFIVWVAYIIREISVATLS